MGVLTTSMSLMALACGLNTPERVLLDKVDLIEVNHYFDDHGRLVFDQVIFYDWSLRLNRFQVRDFRLIKCPDQIPRRNWQRRNFESIWYDGDLLRKVQAKSVRETWTQTDPEFLESSYLPKSRRRKLRQPRVRLPKIK